MLLQILLVIFSDYLKTIDNIDLVGSSQFEAVCQTFLVLAKTLRPKVCLVFANLNNSLLCNF